MRIIRNFLILCVLVCGLLFAARKVGAAMGKGDVWAYRACVLNVCGPRILDMKTMVMVKLNVQRAERMFWAENGALYTVTNDEQICSLCGLYRWGGQILSEEASPVSKYISLVHNGNNLLAFAMRIDGADYLRFWDGVRWIEVVPSAHAPHRTVWAADGRFAFTSMENGKLELYVSDNLTSTNLGQFDEVFPFPTWSADGRLAFISERDGNREIYVWDGTVLTNISQHEADDNNPTWGPDGRLAFTSKRDGNREIYVWDGKTLTNVSQTPENDQGPTWNKDSQLAFVTGEKRAYIWGEAGLRLIELEQDGVFALRWIAHGLLYQRLESAYLWKDGVTTKFLSYNIIEYGDNRVVFVSDRYRADGLYEIYILEGQNIVGTGIVGESGESMQFKADGRGGLMGSVCGGSPFGCDLYHWKDGRIRQLTNTPDIDEYDPIIRP
jgi:WD40-like Beta Propeller Repeat